MTKPNRSGEAGTIAEMVGRPESDEPNLPKAKKPNRPRPATRPKTAAARGCATSGPIATGPVIGVVSVRDDDELLMMTARGKIQRIAVARNQHHRPQHARRANHEPRRRRHAGRHRPRAAGRTERSVARAANGGRSLNGHQ